MGSISSKMRIQELYTKTLQCTNKDCMTRIRIGRSLHLPSAVIGDESRYKYCVVCGKLADEKADSDEDYMEILAESLGVTVELLKQIMLVWDRNKYHRLSEFITALREQDVEEILTA